MICTPKKIKRILKKCINEISMHPKQFANNPEKDFARKRKLPLKQVLKCVLSMTGKSLRGELMDYFNLSFTMPTVSALVQQRSKINYAAFEALFHSFTNSVDEHSLYKGYRLLAVDGSDLHTPTNKDEKSSFYEGANGQKPYYLSFRLVRFKLTEDTYELLITNLTKNEFAVNELKELYSVRWGIETSFRDLKYSLALSYFHSKKTENILQEIFARLTMYNFAELITSHVVVKQKNRKYSYRINFAAAVHICRNFFLKNISPSDVEALLLMHLLPFRQRSANTRRGSPGAAPSFIYRIP